MFLTPGKNIFCFRAAKFVSATHVSRAAKLGNVCIRNDVSATMFPSLARPLLLVARVVVRTSNMKIARRHLADYVKKLPKKHATRAARLFFII